MNKLITNNIMLLKTVAMLVASAICLVGLVLVCTGLRDTGTINIRTAFLEGKLETGSVGITLIFLGIIIILGCFFFLYTDTIEIEAGRLKIKTRGYLGPERLKIIAEDFGELAKALDNNKGNTNKGLEPTCEK